MSKRVEASQQKLEFPSLFNGQELLVKVVELLPYPIQVFSADGFVRFINSAALEMMGIKSIEAHVGKYNVFEDPVLRELGVMDHVRQVLTGEIVSLTDFNAPYQGIVRYFHAADNDIQAITADITCFPLLNADGSVGYFAAVFILKKIYRGREEIALGREYIESHWQQPFNIEEAAKAASLSKSHFIRLFKKNTGVTPHEYYINIKIGKLKEKLLDTNLTIAQAFAACNMGYNGHSARLFRERVGVSPSVYRKKSD